MPPARTACLSASKRIPILPLDHQFHIFRKLVIRRRYSRFVNWEQKADRPFIREFFVFLQDKSSGNILK